MTDSSSVALKRSGWRITFSVWLLAITLFAMNAVFARYRVPAPHSQVLSLFGIVITLVLGSMLALGTWRITISISSWVKRFVATTLVVLAQLLAMTYISAVVTILLYFALGGQK